MGGSADLAGSNNTTIKDAPSFIPSSRGTKEWKADPYQGRVLHFGIREHGMGAIMNGIAADGLTRVFGGTFLTFSDYMRGAVRVAALSQLPVTYVWTHDSIGLGEDGPTHQPIEHLAALRAMPGLDVVRPADGNETSAAWQTILERTDRPAALALTRQTSRPFPAGLGATDAVAVVAQWVAGGGLPPLDSVLLDKGPRVRPVELPVSLEAFPSVPRALFHGHDPSVERPWYAWGIAPESTVGVIPWWPELVAAKTAGAFDQTSKFPPRTLPWLAAAPGPAGPALHHLLALTMGHADEGMRLHAVDGVLTLMADARLDSALFEDSCLRLLRAGKLRLARWASAWEQAALGGGLAMLWGAMRASSTARQGPPPSRPGSATCWPWPAATRRRCPTAVHPRRRSWRSPPPAVPRRPQWRPGPGWRSTVRRRSRRPARTHRRACPHEAHRGIPGPLGDHRHRRRLAARPRDGSGSHARRPGRAAAVLQRAAGPAGGGLLGTARSRRRGGVEVLRRRPRAASGQPGPGGDRER